MAQAPTPGQFLEFDAEKNSLDYLVRACRFIREVRDDPYAWKWTTIALHGAVYGFAVCASYGTDPSVVRDKKGRLISFDQALKMSPVELSQSESDSIRRLKVALRNEFAHFQPKGWLIEIHGMPRICLDALAVTARLAGAGLVPHRLNADQRQLVSTLVRETSAFLKRTDLFRESEVAQKEAGEDA